MKYLLSLVLIVLMTADAFALDLSLGPGLSVKNAMLYLVAMGLAMRMVVQRGARFGMPKVHTGFILLIAYATLSVLITGVIIKLQGYDMRDAVISLKSHLIDLFLFFGVFFYGLQTRGDTMSVMRVMLLVVIFASVVTVGNATGLLAIGHIEINSEGRVQGALGEQNQYGAFIVTFLPVLIAAWAHTRSFVWKSIWLFGAVVTLGALVMTVSRGAFLALIAAAFVGTLIFHRQLPLQKMVLWAAVGVAVMLLLALATGYLDLLHDRVIGQTFVTRGDASSGRTEIWTQALNRMMDVPWTLLTGFGWSGYESMGFKYATHNHYLWLWFNLGLTGLVAFLMIQFELFKTHLEAARAATTDPMLRGYFIAAVFGLIGLSVAIFFVNLTKPWAYLWAFFGISARLVTFALEDKRAAATERAKVTRKPVTRAAPRWQTHAPVRTQPHPR